MSTQTCNPDSDEGSLWGARTENIERERDNEDMRSLNQFMEKAGMLTDDEFFGSL